MFKTTRGENLAQHLFKMNSYYEAMCKSMTANRIKRFLCVLQNDQGEIYFDKVNEQHHSLAEALSIKSMMLTLVTNALNQITYYMTAQ